MDNCHVVSIFEKISKVSSALELEEFFVIYSKHTTIQKYFVAEIETNEQLPDRQLPQSMNVLCSNFGSRQERQFLRFKDATFFDNTNKLGHDFSLKRWSALNSRWEIINVKNNNTLKMSNQEPLTLGISYRSTAQHKKLFIAQKTTGKLRPEWTSFPGLGMRIFEQLDLLQNLATPVLSKGEKDCLTWSACGKTSHEISIILSLSEHTVNHYSVLAAKKLGANNRTHAVAMAIKMGIIPRSELI